MGTVYEAAREQAKQLLASNKWDGKFPVKVQPFTDIFEANVMYSDGLGKISGLVVADPSQPPRIMINSLESRQRRRFTLAHELGHIIERLTLGKDNDYSFLDTRNPDKYDLHEFYADEFAGSLLMPASEVYRCLSEGWTVARMAAYFEVSIPAVKRRLQRLRKHPDRSVATA